MANYNKKKDFVDDGRTIVSMDFDTYGNYKPNQKNQINYQEKRQDLVDVQLTNKERWAIIKAMYRILIPFVIIMFGSFIVVVYILFALWKV